MSEHTDETIIRQLRETVERQAEELAELRRLVEAFGTGSFPFVYAGDEISVSRCRQYNKRKATQCPTSDT